MVRGTRNPIRYRTGHWPLVYCRAVFCCPTVPTSLSHQLAMKRTPANGEIWINAVLIFGYVHLLCLCAPLLWEEWPVFKLHTFVMITTLSLTKNLGKSAKDFVIRYASLTFVNKNYLVWVAASSCCLFNGILRLKSVCNSGTDLFLWTVDAAFGIQWRTSTRWTCLVWCLWRVKTWRAGCTWHAQTRSPSSRMRAKSRALISTPSNQKSSKTYK